MFDDLIDKTAKALFESLPENLGHVKTECQSAFRQILKKRLEDIDLVSREEFDVQKKVLARTRSKIDEIEKKLDVMLKQKP